MRVQYTVRVCDWITCRRWRSMKLNVVCLAAWLTVWTDFACCGPFWKIPTQKHRRARRGPSVRASKTSRYSCQISQFWHLTCLPLSKILTISCAMRIIHCVSKKNAPTLASLDSHGPILIIFGQQHQHTFRNNMHIQLSLCLHFYLLYLLLNSCDGGSEKKRLHSMLALKRAGLSLADVHSDVLLPHAYT